MLEHSAIPCDWLFLNILLTINVEQNSFVYQLIYMLNIEYNILYTVLHTDDDDYDHIHFLWGMVTNVLCTMMSYMCELHELARGVRSGEHGVKRFTNKAFG